MNKTKTALIEAAAILFSEKGFACTSVDNIAKAAGANIAAVNYHFGSKENLFIKAFEYLVEQSESRYPLDPMPEAEPEVRLSALINNLIIQNFDHEIKGNMMSFMRKGLSQPNEFIVSVIYPILAKHRKKTKEIIRLFSGCDDDILLIKLGQTIISQALFIAEFQQQTPKLPLTTEQQKKMNPAQRAATVVTFCLAGIKAVVASEAP